MARIPDEDIRQLKAQTDLAALVRGYGVALKRIGQKDLQGHCPFHNDTKTPNLIVTPSAGLWHCMACDAGGSAIDFVMGKENLSFREAVTKLQGANSYKRRTGPIEAPTSAADVISDYQPELQAAVNHFHQQLRQSEFAMSYLKRRGLDSIEAIDMFKLGYGDKSLGNIMPTGNSEAARNARERFKLAGLSLQNGQHRFASHLVVPIFDAQGNVTEIYGRKVGEQSKAANHYYLPGPHKGIFNFSCLQSSEVIICEALLDAISFWIHGFKNVTSAYGINGFTEEFLQGFISNGVKTAVIAYDADKPGDAAAVALAVRLAAAGITSKRLRFPDGMDANDYIRQHGAGSAAKIKERLLSAETLKQPSKHAKQPEKAAAKENMTAAPAVQPQQNHDDIEIVYGARTWRIRGLMKNRAAESMRVNLRVTVGEGFHIDTLDLYNAKQRTQFLQTAASETGQSFDDLKHDLGKIVLRLEPLLQQVLAAGAVSDVATAELTDDERAEALALLRDPALVKRILADFEAAGIVGEETNKLIGYVAATSRKLTRPLAILIQSASSAGKTSLMDAILRFMPQGDQVKYSAMTGQSLYYMGNKDLKHKILAIVEEEGAQKTSYALKLLQSEGELVIASTTTDPKTGKHDTQEYRVEGPVMVFLTTTSIDIDEELLNRCLVVTVDESREQTRLIHTMQRKSRTLEGRLLHRRRDQIARRHQNAQRLLEPVMVINNYAESLSFIDTQTRTRRDHEKYLTLIDAIALLHQHQREIKTVIDDATGEAVPYIEVSQADIALATELMKPLLTCCLDELPPQTRKLHSLIEKWVAEVCRDNNTAVRPAEPQHALRHFTFSRRELRDRVQWSDTVLKRHLSRLVEMEYLFVHKADFGRFEYELIQIGPGITHPGPGVNELGPGVVRPWSGGGPGAPINGKHKPDADFGELGPILGETPSIRQQIFSFSR